MSKVTSAGILPYRIRNDILQVFISHPGGPFWARKDAGAWSVIKGEVEANEDIFAAARREFKEETGYDAPDGNFIELGSATYYNNYKTTYAWAFLSSEDYLDIRTTMIEIEWPPKSGTTITIPEIDKAEWCDVAHARHCLNPNHLPFLDRLQHVIGPIDEGESGQISTQTTLL